jgi:tRNA(Ile)-lysidine synthase
VTIEKDTRACLASAGFVPTDLLLIGVSGGPDSLALAHVLYSLGWKIALAHFDHQLRSQSAGDCEFVRKTAEEFGVMFYQASEDIQRKAEKEKRSIEEIARNSRYQFLFAVAEQINAKAVLTAHTADDQVETILMHLLRGSGTRGLAGMQICGKTAFHPEIPLVRPLLHTWRGEIDVYCREHCLNPVQDTSNQDRTYFRNRIRHELIPNLETYNPAVKENLVHLAEIVRDDWDYLDTQYSHLFIDLIHLSTPDRVEIPRERFLELERGAQKAILQKALGVLQRDSQAQSEYDTVVRIIQFAHHPTTTSHIALPAHLHAFIEKQNLIITRMAALPLPGTYPQCSGCYSLPTKEPFELEIAPGCILAGANEPVIHYSIPQSSAGFLWEAFLDADRIESNAVTVRSFLPGERYAPLGMGGREIKVSDFFTNKKIPVSLRKDWPLILVKTEIAWIPGFQPAHAFRIQKSTSRVWHFSLKMLK